MVTDEKQSAPPATDDSPPASAARELERLERLELIGKRVRLADGREGEIVHVEYEHPARVALVKTRPETPSPLTRAGVDEQSPSHLPRITGRIG